MDGRHRRQQILNTFFSLVRFSVASPREKEWEREPERPFTANTPAPISFYLKRFFFLSAGDFEIRINLSDCQSMEGYFNFFQQRKGFVKYWFWSFDKLTFFSLRKYLWKFNVVLFQLLGISTISANFSIFLHISYDVVSLCFSDLIYPVLWIHWLSICVTEFY